MMMFDAIVQRAAQRSLSEQNEFGEAFLRYGKGIDPEIVESGGRAGR
jgi:hypothetical protein